MACQLQTDCLKTKVKQHIGEYLCSYPATSELFNGLAAAGDVVLFGGAVRDIVDGVTPRDYDIVFNPKQEVNLEDFLVGTKYRKNRFGGYSFSLENHKFDLWLLENTWAFRERLVDLSIDNLVNTVFFNIDSVAVNLSSSNVYADKYLNAMETKMLDIILPDNPFPSLCVLRAFVFKNKKGLNFSRRINDYIKTWITSVCSPIDELAAIQHKHYGFLALDKDTLNREITAFC